MSGLRVYLAVGSNLGDRRRTIRAAKAYLQKNTKIRILRESPIYETEPVGGPQGQEKYLNGVWEIETSLEPRALLEFLLSTERQLGRVRKEKNAPRPIDLDILFYGDRTIDEPGLTLPHPRLHERGFVLKPLGDLAPDFVHPVLKKTVKDIYTSLIIHENHPQS